MSIYDVESAADGTLTLVTIPLDSLGIRRMHGWGHPRRSPARRWATIYPNGAYVIEHRGWLDHLYRLRYESGRTVYHTEPYDLDDDDLADLSLLRKDGWQVHIGGAPCHHPTTIVITIERRERPDA